MGVVLEFPSERIPTRRADALAGEVVIFPGVRRERIGAQAQDLGAEAPAPRFPSSSPRLPSSSPRKRGS